jgi:hypothetical protein
VADEALVRQDWQDLTREIHTLLIGLIAIPVQWAGQQNGDRNKDDDFHATLTGKNEVIT